MKYENFEVESIPDHKEGFEEKEKEEDEAITNYLKEHENLMNSLKSNRK